MATALATAVNPPNIYQALRGLDSTKVTDAQIAAAFKKVPEARVNANTAGVSFRLVHRVAQATTESEWNEFTKTGQMPPIKLSPEEMELVRGGVANPWLKALGYLLIAVGNFLTA